MSRRIRQRTIYAATAVAVLALVSGFAIASITTFTFQTTAAQGYGTVAPTTTSYACQPVCVSATEIPTTVGANSPCANTPAAATVTGSAPASITIFVNWNGGTTCSGLDFAEEFSFTATVSTNQGCLSVTGGCTDTFTVNTEQATGASISQAGVAAFTGSPPLSGSGTVNVNLYVDYGVTTPPAFTSLSVSVNGNF